MAGSGRAGYAMHGRVMLGATFAMLASAMIVGLSFLNPLLADQFGVGLGEVMLYFSIYQLVAAVMTSTLAPRLIDTFGARPIMIAGGLWTAGMLVGLSFASSLLMLYLFAGGLGLMTTAATMLSANVLVKEWFETKRGTVLGLVSGLAGLGGTSIALVMPSIIGAGGWQLGFRFLALYVTALTVLPGLFLIRSRPSDVGLTAYGAAPKPADGLDVQVPGVPASRAFRSLSFALLALGLVAFNMVLGIHQHLVPLTMERGVDLGGAGLITSAVSLAIIGGSFLMGVLVDRWGSVATVWVACTILSAGLGLLILARGLVPLLGSALAVGVGSTMPMVLAAVLVMACFGPRDFTRILGPVMATGPLGAAIGAPVWGLIKDQLGNYDAALAAFAILTLLAAGAIQVGVAAGRRLRAAVEPGQGFSISPAGAGATR